MKIVDYIFLTCIISIWSMLLLNIILTYFGYKYYLELSKFDDKKIFSFDEPSVTVLIPAHNEEKVIEKTLKSVHDLDYPVEKLEIVVINDNSTDKTLEILENLQKKYVNLRIINTGKEGGKGKSNALNIGLQKTSGEYVVVYDADNTPERKSLRYLVYTILSNDSYGAVVGKFRTRNKARNLLTKFINLEGLNFQWMAQGGRWKLLGISTIPGTNFIIKRKVLNEIGGWDPKAIAEDTEVSIRIYLSGRKICFMPLAVTWEQEPETLKVWIKQRTRWVKGNVYVMWKYMFKLGNLRNSRVIVDISYFFCIYFLFLLSLMTSDIIFLLGILTDIKISVAVNFNLIWILSYIIFILQICIALTMEKGEFNMENFFLVCLSYFTYCQLWLFISLKGSLNYIQDIILKRKQLWYKTERF